MAGQCTSQLRWGRMAVALAAATFTLLGLWQAWQDSPTVDEGIGLSSGLSYWVHHDLRMSPEHPIAPKLLATLPALVAQPIVPKGGTWDQGRWFDYTDVLIRANDDAGRLQLVVFLGRLMPLVEALGSGGLIFLLARRLVSEAGGLLAAGLWFTTPFVLGLGHVQSIDMSFTLATLAVSLALLRHSEAPTVVRGVVVGITLALALATRHTALVLVVVALGVVLSSYGRDWRLGARNAVLVGFVGYLGLFALYRGFDPTAPRGIAGANLDAIVHQAASESPVSRLVLAVPAPLEWQAGFGHLMLTSNERPSWLFGQAWEGSRPWFFPGSLLAKVALPALLTLLMGAGLWFARPGASRRNAALVVAAPATALLLLTMAQPLNLGLRLALPSVALLYVGAAPAVSVIRRRGGRALLGVVAISQLVTVVAAGTHSIAWSPPPFSPAYRYVSDANVDFGQGGWELRSWSEGRSPWVSVISTRGFEPPVGSRRLIGAAPSMVTGWVAVGVTSLTVLRRDELSWLRAYCPVGYLAGGAILIYHFTAAPTAAPGPTRPAAPCLGAPQSSRRL